MKKLFRRLGAVLLMAGLASWLALGANRGWTKTSVETKILDEVTGIEQIRYDKKFKPGVDFLAATAAGAGGLFLVSIFIRTKTNKTQHPS